MIPKGWRAREQAAEERRKRRLVSPRSVRPAPRCSTVSPCPLPTPRPRRPVTPRPRTARQGPRREEASLMAGRISPEVRAARAAAIFEAEEKAKANPPDPPAFSTLIGWAERPAPKPPAIQPGSGLPGEATTFSSTPERIPSRCSSSSTALPQAEAARPQEVDDGVCHPCRHRRPVRRAAPDPGLRPQQGPRRRRRGHQIRLQAADDEINLYLSAQYGVPLPYVSGGMRKIAVNIAVYTMAMDRAVRTEEMRLRYVDAIAQLKMMAEGKIGIGAPPIDTDGDGVPDLDPNRKRKGRIFDIGRG